MRDSRWVAAVPAIVMLLFAGAAQATGAGFCGGGGGNQATARLDCPSGQFIVGISARGASFVDGIGVRCAPFDAAGKRIGQGDWINTGTLGGTTAGDATCASTAAVKSLRLRSGIYVDRVKGIQCTARKPGGFGTPLTSKSINVGGGGGADCQLTCPSGEALYSLVVKKGSWIDRIGGGCRK